MLDYALLKALREVVATGSFEAAARRLGVTPSAVSQRIRLLEERTGAALVVRGQPCRATAPGARLCRHVDEVELLEDGVREALGTAEAEAGWPRLGIAVNADSLESWFVPALALVPGRLFALAVEDEEHTAEALRRGEVSAAVSAAPGPIPGCSTAALGLLRYEAVASPAFAERWFADGATAETVARAPCLRFGTRDGLQDRWLRQVLGSAPERPLHTVPSTGGFLQASLAGVGWGMNPLALAAEHLAVGRLVRLGTRFEPLRVPLFWHWSRALGPALRPLTDAVRRTARLALDPAD